jgi:outer membrane protein assembly factor BamE (lipoprotein component of BamABCDE complex)
MMKTTWNTAVAVLATVLAAGCSATHHAGDVRAADNIDRVTVGTVQKEIRLGMSAADVASALGSPNIVTTDEQRHETWIYDKISNDVTYSRSSGTVVGLIFGSSAGGAGVGSTSAGSSSSSQRTLTVVIKFDGSNAVRDFSYHTSRF